jgi:ribosomal protein S4E
VIIKIPEQEIKEHLRLEKNSNIFLIDGKHNGEIGTVTDIIGRKIKYRLSDDETVETTAEHVFVIGKDAPVVKVC